MKEKILGFLKETLGEMKKVSWPDRKYVTAATIVVFVIVVLTAVFVTLVDFALAEVFKVLLR